MTWDGRLGRMQNPEVQSQREVLTRGLWLAVWLLRRVKLEIPQVHLGVALADEVSSGLATLESLLEPGREGGDRPAPPPSRDRL